MFTSSKCLWAGLLFYTFIAFAGAQGPPTPNPFTRISDHFYYQCYNVTKDVKAFDKLYTNATEFTAYLKYAFQFIPESKTHFCTKERRPLERRIEQVATNFKLCLREEDKELADLIQKIFNQFLMFLCKDEGVNIDKFFSTRAAFCRTALRGDPRGDPSDQTGECFNRILKPFSGAVSKTKVCGDLKKAEICFQVILERQCPNYMPYKELNKEFFEYIYKPCSGCVTYLNTMLLTISLFLSFLSR